MKRYAYSIGLLLLSVMLVLCGCGKTQGESTESSDGNAAVYYINNNGSDLVAEKVTMPGTGRSGQLTFLLNKLISPEDGKISPLHQGTILLSVTMQHDIAVVNFSAQYYGDDNVKKILAPTAVAKTLCSLDFVSGVQILVEGQPAVDANQKSLGIIRENDLVLNKGGPSQAPKTALLLYFANDSAEFLVPERRSVEISAGSTVEKVLVEELIKGPTEGGHYKTIPQETKLLSIETKNRVCFVNLSKEFVEKHSGGTSAERLTVYSVVNSLTELGTIDSVQFLIEGEKREEFIHMAFNEPIIKDRNMISQ